MSKATNTETKTQRGDLVLQEVWRAKDTLSGAYGHDLNKLFEEMRKREKLSRHPLATLPIKRRKT